MTPVPPLIRALLAVGVCAWVLLVSTLLTSIVLAVITP